MMDTIGQIINFFKHLFSWWVIIMPWEQAVLVRNGKNVRILRKGIHFKIPFFDRIYLQPIRLRVVDMPIQTITTSDGVTITLRCALKYSIGDIFKVYNTLNQPEITLAAMVMGEVAKYIYQQKESDLNIDLAEKIAISAINADAFGLINVSVNITSWASVKTFRLIQDQSWMSETFKMNQLE